MAALRDAFPAELEVAAPNIVGGLAVFPLIAQGPPTVSYISLKTALEQGLTVKELDGGASVTDLLVTNPLDTTVLIFEGQEVLGAQQNRTFDVSTLIAANSKTVVPVTCVEQGRWDGRRHAESFSLAPQAAYPELRRQKSVAVQARMAAGAEARADQGKVWDEVATRSAAHDVASDTGAMSDVFDSRREQLDRVAREIEMGCSQAGNLVAIDGKFVVLDYISDPDVLADMHGALVQGYALDALGRETEAVAPPTLDDARDFLGLLLGADAATGDSVGIGETLRFEFGALAGVGIGADGEVVALSAFGR